MTPQHRYALILFLLLLFPALVLGKPKDGNIANPPQSYSSNGFTIRSDRTTYYCTEYLSPSRCLIVATINITNLNTKKYNLENIVSFTTSVTNTKFKDKTGVLLPKKTDFSTNKIEIKRDETLVLTLEFEVSGSGKFNYSIDVFDGTTYLFRITLDPYYEFYYQSSDGSKEGNQLIESDSLNNYYAMSILIPFNLSIGSSFPYSFCMFAQTNSSSPKVTPFFAVDTNNDFAPEHLFFFSPRAITNYYEWNCWNFTYTHSASFPIVAGQRGFWGFKCSDCGLNTGGLIAPTYGLYKSGDNKRQYYIIFNDKPYTYTYLDFTIRADKGTCTFSKCEAIAGLTLQNLNNATHFVCRYYGAKTLTTGVTLDPARPYIETTAACPFNNPKLTWNSLTPAYYDTSFSNMLLGLDTNSAPKNRSYRFNVASNKYLPFPTGGNLMFALDLVNQNCFYSKQLINTGNCLSNFSRKLTYNETLPNCTSRLVYEWQWCDYGCDYSLEYLTEDSCLVNDSVKVYYNETLTNCSWRIKQVWESCDYCLPDWRPYVFNNSWQCINVNGSWREYRTYYDYALCYSETGLETDACDYYYPDCDEWVACTHLDSDFDCTIPSAPFLDNDKISFLCYLPTDNWSCYTYVKTLNEEMYLQTNPDYFFDDPPYLVLGTYNPVFDATAFKTQNGLLRAYITNKNLNPKNKYIAGVVCAEQGTNAIMAHSRFIIPQYRDLSWFAYRGEWLKENMGVVVGVFLFSALILVLITTIWRAR